MLLTNCLPDLTILKKITDIILKILLDIVRVSLPATFYKRYINAFLNPKKGFSLFVTKIANRTDSNSNCNFNNILRGRFDTIFRSIRYSVKF